MLDFAQSVPECPILTLMFTCVYNNTMNLAKHYAYMTQSGCLTNMSISCLAPAMFQKTDILNALPRLSHDAKFSNFAVQDMSQEKDIFLLYILKYFYIIIFNYV